MSLSVLIVDDNLDILSNVRDYLEMSGLMVETAVNGQEALDRMYDSRTCYRGYAYGKCGFHGRRTVVHRHRR